MNETRKRQNPVTLLACLPAVIEIRDVRLKAGYERKTAIEALSKWADAGYVSQFASGVYFNLISAPHSPKTEVFEAVERTLRRPVALIGASALSAAGWTTQMPSGYEMAVAVNRYNRTWKNMSGIATEPRPVVWFENLAKHLVRTEGDFDRLPPAFALVDAIDSGERFEALPREARMKLLESGRVTWHPDPDDISLPIELSPEDAWRQIAEAADILDVPFETVRNYAAGIPELEDIVSADTVSPQAQQQRRY